MKKILNISVIAALAILPMAANAAVGDVVSSTDPAHADSATAATANPGYALATEGANDSNLATAGYVKGAYNATMKAINKVATVAGSAVQSVTTGTTDGTINVDGTDVAVHGLGSAAYTDSTAYATAAQGDTADQAAADIGTMTNLTTTEKGSLVGAINELKTASGNYATKTGVTNTITASTISGTVPVLTTWNNDNSTDTVDITASITGATYAE